MKSEIKKKLRKGEIVKVSGEDYIVNDFLEKYEGDEKIVEADLIKEGETDEESEGKKQGRKKFKLSYNEKTGEKKFLRESEEKEVSKNRFSFKSSKVYINKSGDFE